MTAIRTNKSTKIQQLTNLPKINKNSLLDMWLNSFSKDANHALRDAHKNLKGFTPKFKYHLEHQTVDVAFRAAVKASL